MYVSVALSPNSICTIAHTHTSIGSLSHQNDLCICVSVTKGEREQFARTMCRFYALTFRVFIHTFVNVANFLIFALSVSAHDCVWVCVCVCVSWVFNTEWNCNAMRDFVVVVVVSSRSNSLTWHCMHKCMLQYLVIVLHAILIERQKHSLYAPTYWSKPWLEMLHKILKTNKIISHMLVTMHIFF